MRLAALLADSGHAPPSPDELTLLAMAVGRGARFRHVAAFLDDDGMAKELESLGGEGKSTALGQVQLPKRAALDELSSSCKLSVGRKLLNSLDETLSAKDQGSDVAKAARCAQSGGDVVLDGFFGQALGSNAKREATGVEFKGSTEVPLGSLLRKQLHAVQDTCRDLSTVLLHRLDPGKGGEAGSAVNTLNADDAAHILRSYGRCMMSMGEASSAAGCRLGQLKREGGGETEKMCEESLGPNPTNCCVM